MPSRSCVACRTVRPKRELLRVVRMPDGSISVDISGRTPGRGAYVCRESACLSRAVEKGALGRALSTKVPPAVQATLLDAITTPDTITTTTLHIDQGGARGQE